MFRRVVISEWVNADIYLEQTQYIQIPDGLDESGEMEFISNRFTENPIPIDEKYIKEFAEVESRHIDWRYTTPPKPGISD